jgi:hypothetical protein
MFLELVVAKYKEDVAWAGACGMPAVIYDKSDAPVPGSVSLPNIGREAHTYLHHIISRYNSLAEMTVFVQGNPFDHCPHLFSLITSIPLSGFHWLAKGLVICDEQGMPHNGTPLPLGKTFESLFGWPRKSYQFGPGAQFAVSRELIQRWPRGTWEKILTVWESMGPGYPWVAERLWGYLFLEKQIIAAQAASPGELRAA